MPDRLILPLAYHVSKGQGQTTKHRSEVNWHSLQEVWKKNSGLITHAVSGDQCDYWMRRHQLVSQGNAQQRFLRVTIFVYPSATDRKQIGVYSVRTALQTLPRPLERLFINSHRVLLVGSVHAHTPRELTWDTIGPPAQTPAHRFPSEARGTEAVSVPAWQ